jgi:hypothetical protein
MRHPFYTVFTVVFAVLAIVDCATNGPVRPTSQDAPTCPPHVIDYVRRCSGRVYHLTNCNLCFRKTGKVFPGVEDMVTACVDTERNAYCVDTAVGCDDGACEQSLVPAFGAHAPEKKDGGAK